VIEPAIDIAELERQLAALSAPDPEDVEVLLRLAEVIFPGRQGIGDPARIVWPEQGPRQPAQLEAQIRESEARFRSLVEQLPAVVFYAALGDEDNEIYVSPQIEALLGFTQEEWLTNPLLWYTQLHPDDHDIVIEAFTRGVQTGGPFRAEVRFLSRDGEEVWILGEARLMRDAGQRPAYFQGVAFDITPAKRAQEAMAQAERAKSEADRLRADAFAARNTELTELNEQLRVARDSAEAAARARSTFLTTMSHELRTPLNSVIVLAGLLAEDKLSPGQRDMVRRMRLASDHLLELINDVLEFSRLRAGPVELERRTFDLARWLSDTIDIVAPRAAEKGLEVRVRIAPGLPVRVVSDDGRLRQVLLNLLGNAVKFTAEGYIEVTLGGHRVDPGDAWEFQCSVRDTGIGVRPETAAGLFDEFRQGDSGVSREFGGTGLGLAICKQLCEMLGGRIWVEGVGGPGAVFTFTWRADGADGRPQPVGGQERHHRNPAAATSRHRPGGGLATLARPLQRFRTRPSAGAALHPAALGTPRVLLVDDDLMNQEVGILLLGSMGHRADVVSSGDKAIGATVRQPYDVVLMDVSMPAIDGLCATRLIRGLGNAIHQPYIVAVTANALPGDSERCMAAGMDDYVTKPIDREELGRALAAGGKPRTAPASPGSAGAPGFDRSVAIRILGEFGLEPLHRLISIFGTQAPQLADAAVVAAAAGDAEQAQRAAHTLKSSAANMGAVGLAAACAEIETMARTGHLDGLGPLTTALGSLVSAALEELDALAAGLPPAAS
jgi:PAS domain S-box-containing protein